jgi:hypothetical protein
LYSLKIKKLVKKLIHLSDIKKYLISLVICFLLFLFFFSTNELDDTPQQVKTLDKI